MHQYLTLLQHVLDQGAAKPDRTGTGTRSVFGYQLRFDLAAGFPLLTTKKLHLRSIIHELLWFLRGQTNVQYLRENSVSIWDPWADPDTGELGPVYGYQWRSWPIDSRPEASGDGPVPNGHVDQIQQVIDSIKTNPHSRRHIVSAWNVGQLDQMALPPCHLLFQFYVQPTDRTQPNRLCCQLYQRSADIFLGLPFNIASYALLTQMMAQITGLAPGELIVCLGDAHLYDNHVDQARAQLQRDPRPLPTMRLNPEISFANGADITDFAYDDFTLENYDPHPHIKAAVAV